jgi:hypothetical protein
MMRQGRTTHIVFDDHDGERLKALDQFGSRSGGRQAAVGCPSEKVGLTARAADLQEAALAGEVFASTCALPDR